MSKKIYLASPFFNDKEIEIMETVKGILRAKGLEVFAPFENQNKHLEFGSKEWREATFKGDVDGINNADVVVGINANGNYDDVGTAWELGYAYAKGIPFILVNPSKETINLMVADSLHGVIFSYEELEKYDFDKMPKIEYTNYVW